MVEFVVPLREEIKDSLTRHGMQIMRGLHRNLLLKGLAEKEKEERKHLSKKHTNKYQGLQGLQEKGTYVKIGTIQRRLAWPLRKDEEKREA